MWKYLTLALMAAAIGMSTMSTISFAAGPDDCQEGQVWDEETKTCKPAE